MTPYGIALVHVGLGNKDEAFRWLEKAFDDRANWLVWLRFGPRWEALRKDPRYAEMIQRMGFPASSGV